MLHKYQKEILRKLDIVGLTQEKYGCKKHRMIAMAAYLFQIYRVDCSIGLYVFVQNCLGMRSIESLGSEEQKNQFLPQIARFQKDICWALSEPSRGSDASGMKTSATPVEGGFKLNGVKRWIGNALHADLLIVFARNTETKLVQGFIAKKGMKGLSTKKIQGKWAARSFQNAQIYFNDVFIPNELVLPGVKSFFDVSQHLLTWTRVVVAWQTAGAAAGAWDAMMENVKSRSSMGKPILKHQLVQEKVGRSLAHIQACLVLAKRAIDLIERGELTMGQASLIKGYTTLLGRQAIALVREVMGGDGILLQNQAIKMLNDIEVAYTGEGTYDINMLVAGREITGHSAFK